MTDKQDIIQTVVDRAAIMAKEPVSLDSQELTDADMPGLVAALQGCPAGTVVYLTNNQIGPQGAQILADLVETNPNIGGLILMGNPIGDDGAMAIVSALHPNSNLCTLIVMDCGLSDEGVRALDDAMVRISPKNMVGYLADGEKSTELQGLLDENAPHR